MCVCRCECVSACVCARVRDCSLPLSPNTFGHHTDQQTPWLEVKARKKYGHKREKNPQKEQRKLTVMLCNFDKLFIEISLFGSQLPIYTKENIPALVIAFKGF